MVQPLPVESCRHSLLCPQPAGSRGRLEGERERGREGGREVGGREGGRKVK